MPEVTLALRTPAAIGDVPGTGFVRQSLTHVPGSVLRGAVAAGWLRAGRAVDEDFLSAFERDVVWGPLFLPGSEPQPLSHWVHKYASTKRCPAFWDEASEPVPAGRNCPECGDPLEPSRGQVLGVQRTMDAHVQLSNGRAVDGALFARERLARGQTFVGWVVPQTERGKASLDDALRTVGWDGEGAQGRIWVGGRRSTDGGRSELTVSSKSREVARLEGNSLVLSLVSPGIFVDDYGFPTGEPRPDEITEVLGVASRVTQSWVRWTTIGGWHAAARLPKPAERVVAAGSVFRIDCEERPGPERVETLLGRGLGLRRVEGYGTLRAMPAKPRGHAEISQGVIPLRGLPHGLLDQVQSVVVQCQSAIRVGAVPEWGVVAGMASNPKVPPHFSEAARFLMTLTTADELTIAGEVLREQR